MTSDIPPGCYLLDNDFIPLTIKQIEPYVTTQGQTSMSIQKSVQKISTPPAPAPLKLAPTPKSISLPAQVQSFSSTCGLKNDSRTTRSAAATAKFTLPSGWFYYKLYPCSYGDSSNCKKVKRNCYYSHSDIPSEKWYPRGLIVKDTRNTDNRIPEDFVPYKEIYCPFGNNCRYKECPTLCIGRHFDDPPMAPNILIFKNYINERASKLVMFNHEKQRTHTPATTTTTSSITMPTSRKRSRSRSPILDRSTKQHKLTESVDARTIAPIEQSQPQLHPHPYTFSGYSSTNTMVQHPQMQQSMMYPPMQQPVQPVQPTFQQLMMSDPVILARMQSLAASTMFNMFNANPR